ncbi:MAG: conjugal transfer protein TraL [Deltaproteobacteria bacterium]|nr:conjugal transfer protein TraL [Deltaproteobacteria bacterium]
MSAQSKIPQYLHRPSQTLWWESDEFGLIIFVFILILVFGLKFIFLGIIPYIYSKIKSKYNRGFMNHLPYMLGLKDIKGYPLFFVRRFFE